MKIELLAESVIRLSQCDVDDPADSKTIAMCENYILSSYELYLETCNLEGYKPLTKNEYMQKLMLNEGFFKKLLAGAVATGATVTGIKAYNASKNAGGAKNLVNQSGSIKNAIKNVASTSMSGKTAATQYAGAKRVQDNSDNGAGNSLQIMKAREAREANKNGQTVQGQTNIINKNGNTSNTITQYNTSNRNMENQTRNITDKNGNNTVINSKDDGTTEVQKLNSDGSVNQEEQKKVDNTKAMHEKNTAKVDMRDAANMAQAYKNMSDEERAEYKQLKKNNPGKAAELIEKKQQEMNKLQSQNQVNNKKEFLAEKNQKIMRDNQKVNNASKKSKGKKAAVNTVNTLKGNENDQSNNNNSQNNGQIQPVNESWLCNLTIKSMNDILLELLDYDIDTFYEDVIIISESGMTDKEFKDILNEELGSVFNASALKEPLTPAIRKPYKLI